MKLLTVTVALALILLAGGCSKEELKGPPHDPEGLPADVDEYESYADMEMNRDKEGMDRETKELAERIANDARNAYNEDAPLNSDFEVYRDVYKDLRKHIHENKTEYTNEEYRFHTSVLIMLVASSEVISSEDNESRQESVENLGDAINDIESDMAEMPSY